MDVKEESVAPWNLDGRVEVEEDDDTPSGGGMNDVTTATGCAVSRRSARNLCDRPCTYLLLLATALAGDQRFGELVAEIVSGRNMVTKKGSDQDLYSFGNQSLGSFQPNSFHAFLAARVLLVSGHSTQQLTAVFADIC